MKTTGCNVDKVTILPNALITPLISSSMIKTEDVTPMEVTSEKRSSPIFQVSFVTNALYLSHIRKIAIFPFIVFSIPDTVNEFCFSEQMLYRSVKLLTK